MISIRFPDRTTEKQALAFMLGRFSGRVLQTGEHLVPEAALARVELKLNQVAVLF